MERKDRKERKVAAIISLVIICCTTMAIVEMVIEPAYIVKSAIKIALFFIVPMIAMKTQNISVFSDSFALNFKSIAKLLGLGLAIYSTIMVAFVFTRGVFDYTALVDSLSADQNVSPQNFIWIALYISFGNSLLEEFMFRLVAFLILSDLIGKKAAYLFSSLTFAVYHVAMIGSSFPFPLLIISLIGLAMGGMIFNYVDEKKRNIYNSWIVHMFADFAIMSIWYIHI